MYVEAKMQILSSRRHRSRREGGGGNCSDGSEDDVLVCIRQPFYCFFIELECGKEAILGIYSELSLACG